MRSGFRSRVRLGGYRRTVRVKAGPIRAGHEAAKGGVHRVSPGCAMRAAHEVAKPLHASPRTDDLEDIM